MEDSLPSHSKVYGDAPFLIFCDHASNRIPAEFNDLGLSEDVLQTHIAWDIGAKALSHALGDRLQARVLHCGFSRLMIDVNRDPAVTDSIPQVSDQITVPGNQMLTESERASRVENLFDVYHLALGGAVEEISANSNAFVVSVHSFTKRMMGAAEDRPWDVGLLWREDERSAHAMMDYLRDESSWAVGDNQPYDARLYNYSVDRHVGPRGLRHLTFEVRQDHISSAAGVEEACEQLAGAILHVAQS